ncbi:MAG: hypothetical protein R8G34_18620 [Paracoccaceae bacterium]|nr:hypothetical protein [Paracoccaceae bacterium]
MARLLFTLAFVFLATLGWAQENDAPDATPQIEGPMTLQRLSEIILVIDADARVQGAAMEFTVQDIPVVVIADPRADRMRAMVPIRSAQDLKEADLLRMMQANFDSALDARYAVARGRLWGVFIHPLSPLKQDQFLSAVAQTVNVARTYGQTYSGGAQVFGGGDSNGIYQELLDDLRKGQKL